MCENCISLSMKSLYDELEKGVQRVCTCVCMRVFCVHMWSESLIASLAFVVLSSVSPVKYTSVSSEPVSKEEKNNKKIEN